MTNPTVSAGKIATCTVNGSDISAIVTVLEYFESIYSPTASCNLTLADASGFNQSANLKGNEDVEIAFGNRDGDSIRMKFKTCKITERMRVKDNMDMYVIVACADEFLNQNKKSINKAYTNKKISDIVKEVHEVYTKDSNGIKKDLATNEETKGNMSYRGTGRSPIPVIRWAAKEGFSAQAKASNYVYYQDRDGYHFKTIDSMLQGGATDTLNYAIQNSPVNSTPEKTIISFQQKTDTDALSSSFYGGSSTHEYYYDITTGKIGGGEKRDGKGKTTHTGKDVIGEKETQSETGQRFNLRATNNGGWVGSASGSKFVKSRDPKLVENKRTISEHNASSTAALLLDNLVMNVRVPGSTKYKPGVKIKLNIPANQEQGTLDNRSGDYLITAVRHVVFRDDKDVKYDCVLECKSDAHSKSNKNNASGGILV